MPKVLQKVARPEVKSSSALSLFARPGDGSVKTRRVAILVANGVDASIAALHTALSGAGAAPRFVSARLGRVKSTSGELLDVEVTLEAAPSVLFDAMVLPDGPEAIQALSKEGHAIEFIKDQYRHCKPMLVLGASGELIDKAGIPATLPDGGEDPGVLRFAPRDATDLSKAAAAFMAAIGKHRFFERQTDPPLV
jgi:catalase